MNNLPASSSPQLNKITGGTRRVTELVGDLEIEWRYRYWERIGILCGTDQPTEEQKAIARQEADQAIEELKKEE